MVRFVSLVLISCPAIALLSSCRTTSVQKQTPTAEPYISDPNSVVFDITPSLTNAGSRRWLASYSDQGKSAKFVIEIGPPTPMESEAGDSLRMSSGKGAILSEPLSDASTMLVSLKNALEAKHLPEHIKRASRLPFSYVTFGENESQASGGGFSAEPAGNWTAMKIFLGNGDDEGEVFLNFNPISGKAQFAEKDVDYGDSVVAKLATVL